VAAQGDDIVPLVGARTRARLSESLGALDVTLSADDLAAIERAVPKDAAAGDALRRGPDGPPRQRTLTLADGTKISIPLRVVANGDGAEVTLTLFRVPGMDDAAFERDAGMVAKDLSALKALLEA
jgi:hypothetical protein